MIYNEFVEHVKGINEGTSDFAPIYLLTGKDEYIVEKVKKALLSFVDADYMDFNYSEFNQDNYLDAIDSLYTFPMFSSLRMVYLEITGTSSFDGIQDAINKYLQSPSETSIFLVDATSAPDFAKGMKKCEKVNCEFEDSNARYREIQLLVKENPSREIESKACMELDKRTQGNMHRVIAELKKLKAYTSDIITYQDVVDMVSADLEYRVYEIAKAVSEKNTNEALQALNIVIQNGIQSTTILGSFYDRYRMMLHCSLNKDIPNGELAKYLGINESAVYFVKKNAAEYSQMKLKRCVDYLHNLNCEVVYGKRQANSALYEALLKLISL